MDFTIEVERSLRVLDGAVGVFCAVGGVEPQSETVWRQSEKFRIPKLAFINKMDRLGADFEGVLESMRTKLGANPVALQVPVGQGQEFEAVIDLLHMERLVFSPDDMEQAMNVCPWRLGCRIGRTLARTIDRSRCGRKRYPSGTIPVRNRSIRVRTQRSHTRGNLQIDHRARFCRVRFA